MELPAEHFGAVEKRAWYKVKWMKNLPGQSVEGRIDLVREEDLPAIKAFVEIIQEIKAEKCVAGIRLDYGKTSEEEIDGWIGKNAKR